MPGLEQKEMMLLLLQRTIHCNTALYHIFCNAQLFDNVDIAQPRFFQNFAKHGVIRWLTLIDSSFWNLNATLIFFSEDKKLRRITAITDYVSKCFLDHNRFLRQKRLSIKLNYFISV